MELAPVCTIARIEQENSVGIFMRGTIHMRAPSPSHVRKRGGGQKIRILYLNALSCPF